MNWTQEQTKNVYKYHLDKIMEIKEILKELEDITPKLKEQSECEHRDLECVSSFILCIDRCSKCGAEFSY